ncbi:D-amino-acid dehydrogenase [Pseudonocardia thermophila]|jgi:Glycine/D-amino acid oxidases (deaminating)|uniref:D-amino-acid dehydrogenase n=1 Tax=Pseudonocardia thermophila TaxID=1848 RepID=A0A1M6XX20_PSETH|nr:FAD-dependent oxidoreductase [Pseudonocardia thermophila]SHL10375.1 D-amino-acid dehydrogenase [Pseudonocardia thermophila]
MTREPRHVIVVGAGIVGLSCAWYLQRRGAEVTVLDRSGVAAGASWGNAGYLAPAMSVPLPEPAILKEGLRGLASPDSPLSIDPRPSREAAAFVAGFARNSTARRWERGLRSLAPLAARALAAFDELADGGVALETHDAPIRVGLRPQDDAAGLIHELDAARAAGQVVDYKEVPVAAPFSALVATSYEVAGQRFVDPGRVVTALADAVRADGGRIVEGAAARTIGFGPRGLQVDTWAGPPHVGDAVVLATGAWIPELGRRLGVRVPVVAGRGYSCTVSLAEPLRTPVYLPGVRVAITPYRDGARLAGTMEITDRDAPFRERRLTAILDSAEPLLDGLDRGSVRDRWVGPRPLTPDGLPVIGRTRVPGVYVAGGHGMWGLTLGPITGRLLADLVVSGTAPAELAPFDPGRNPLR